ncbi:glutamyl-tRNA reductase [Litorivicinus lipolyticus]|uniref:Glutamyl-tRNA reductase n=1 Tax=Litorivicinus lipolyticus TaxID=418701 RepID=A0A5Q2QCH8_9GAMM|nr:glutamyl-tRNA reductase [Litorivicinus lipolyticus]
MRDNNVFITGQIFVTLLAIGLNHDTAPVDLRERLAVSESEIPGQLAQIKAATGASESLILSTCNRTEVVIQGEHTDETAMLHWLAKRADLDPAQLSAHIYRYHDADAARHLMRVAAGLDSLVLGEPQIFGQLKTAMAVAKANGHLGSSMHHLLQHVFGAAKKVRTQTDVGKEPVSVAFAAVRLAERVFDSLEDCNAVLLGAGETCALVGRHLRQRGIGELRLVNRSMGRCREVAAELNAQALPLNQLGDALVHADLLVCSTAAPLPLVGKGMVERALKARRRRPIMIVDVAVPRDVEPEVDELADVYLYSVDDLREVIDKGRAKRAEAGSRAELIIEAEIESLARDQAVRDAGRHVAQLRQRGASQAEVALTKSLSRLRKGESPELVLARMAHELTQKLLHEPSLGLRDAATHPEQLAQALKVLGLDKDDRD